MQTQKRSLGRLARWAPLATMALALNLIGCSAGDAGVAGSKDEGAGGGPLNPGVGQGGAQDFGQFRQILLDGGIPGPETIDDVGFFNEHVIDLPPANCGENVCLHGVLGVMGNMISGSNCTMVLLGMNTPIDPDELERPPLNLAFAIDTSGSMSGASMGAVIDGLDAMVDALEPEDRVSIVAFSDDAEVQVEYAGASDPALRDAIDSLQANGATNVYDGLRRAYELVGEHAEDGRQNRVILLSDGVATTGIVNDSKIIHMAGAYADAGIGTTTIGMGTAFDVELMRTLSEEGSGAFYFLEDPMAVREVFVEEVESFLVPIAEQAHIGVDISDGYDLRAVYGTKKSVEQGNSASIDIATLQIAHRLDDQDNEGGRRGGGGAILLELLPNGAAPADVGRLTFDYIDPMTGETVGQTVDIESPLAAWETPEDGYFSEGAGEKGFVMLNIYVGFQMAATRASVGDDAGALTVLEPLRDAVFEWLQSNPDEDIEDDLRYIDLFLENLRERGAVVNTPNPLPPEPWPNGD